LEAGNDFGSQLQAWTQVSEGLVAEGVELVQGKGGEVFKFGLPQWAKDFSWAVAAPGAFTGLGAWGGGELGGGDVDCPLAHEREIASGEDGGREACAGFKDYRFQVIQALMIKVPD